jgi:hypothetical protein
MTPPPVPGSTAQSLAFHDGDAARPDADHIDQLLPAQGEHGGRSAAHALACLNSAIHSRQFTLADHRRVAIDLSL